MNRYNRHIILSEIGQAGQDKISNAKVLVIGAGGLGCPILQYLVAAGVGTLGIIDFDVVEKSNLQRQVLFGKSSLGINKAIAAKKRLEDLNEDIFIIAYPEVLNYQNALELFNAYDIIVDGSDNFETRYLVNDACIITNKPLVYGAIYKFEGQVAVFNYQNGPSYRCLFPNPPKKENAPNCSEIGVLGVLPGIIGTMQANEVLKIILGVGNVLSGKILYYNALNSQTSILSIKKNKAIFQSVLDEQEDFSNRILDLNCTNEIALENINFEAVQFIDVRELTELPKIKNIEVTSIPLNELKQNLHRIDSNKKKVVFCQSGIRSKQAVQQLNEHHIMNCFILKQGASELNNYKKLITNEG